MNSFFVYSSSLYFRWQYLDQISIDFKKLYEVWNRNEIIFNLRGVAACWLYSFRSYNQKRESVTFQKSLKQIARQVWKAVTPQYLEKLYDSMPLGMQAVIAQQGGHTKY